MRGEGTGMHGYHRAMQDVLRFAHGALTWALPVLLAITVHEVSHGLAARALGDDTAARAGRLSLNPLRHVDPVGTILVPAALLLLGGVLFGWAKPVPVDFGRLRRPRRDMAIVAAAGPAVNVAMATGWAALFCIVEPLQSRGVLATGAAAMAVAGVSVNVALAVLNLLPVPPLDGGRIAVGLLPPAAARLLSRVEPFGLLVLLGLIATGALGDFMTPAVAWLQALVFRSVNALV
jgi:Zn-dependent protease